MLITPPEVTFDRLGGGTSAAWQLVLVTEPPGGLRAWEQLDELLEQLAEHVNVTTARPAQYTLAGDVDPFPAYLVNATD